MPSDQLSPEGDHRYVKMQSEPPIAVPSSHSFGLQEHPRIFDELPKADIVSVSRPDARDISPMLLSYTVEFRYKQFKWRLVKKASQVLCLHLTLEKRAFIEELHEKQEQVKEWLQNLGLGEHTLVVQDDEPVTLAQEENLSAKSRWLSRPHRLRREGGDITSAASGEGGRRRIGIIEGERHKIFRFSLFFRLIPLGSERQQSKSTVTDQFQMVMRRKQPQSTVEGWCNAFPPHRTYGRLCDGGPLVTNQVYAHSKLMIVGDQVALVGSANINDRSLLGSRDSKINVLIEDKEFVESLMDGQPWKAGNFSRSLRLSLWLEHLGPCAGQINQIQDPVADATYRDIRMATAKTNATIYHDVFSCVPNDLIHTRSAFRQSTNYCKEKIGHTTIDFGIAPKKLEGLSEWRHKKHGSNGEITVSERSPCFFSFGFFAQ